MCIFSGEQCMKQTITERWGRLPSTSFEISEYLKTEFELYTILHNCGIKIHINEIKTFMKKVFLLPYPEGQQ
jgi:hypothetical protein